MNINELKSGNLIGYNQYSSIEIDFRKFKVKENCEKHIIIKKHNDACGRELIIPHSEFTEKNWFPIKTKKTTNITTKILKTIKDLF